MRYTTGLGLGFGTLIAVLGYGCGGDEFVATVGGAGEGPMAGAAGNAAETAEVGGAAMAGSTQTGGSGGDAGGRGGLGGSTGGPGGTGGETSGSGGTGGETVGPGGTGGETSGPGGTGGETVGPGGTGGRHGSGGQATGGAGTGGDGAGGESVGGGGTGGDGIGGGTVSGGGTGGDGTGGDGVGGLGTGGDGVGGLGTGGDGLGGFGLGGTPSGGTGGVVVLTEDCLNGSDDDLDQLIDCNDPDCAEGYRCVPLPPDGWLTVGSIVAEPTHDCGEVFPSRVGLFSESDLEAEAAQCHCSCGEPEGIECNATLYCYSAPGCGNEVLAQPIGADCTPVSSGSAGEVIGSCLASRPVAVGGECAPAGGVTVPSYAWPEEGHACVRDGGGQCDDSTQCVPVDPGAPDRFCIAYPDDVSCPDGYSVAVTHEDGTVLDTRGCEPCSCGAPSGLACGCNDTNQCTVQLYTNGCGGTSSPIILPADEQTCVPLSTQEGNNLEAMLMGASVSSVGECQASLPSATGGVTPAGRITICCTE